MLRRWCIPLAGLALVAGAVATSAPAAAAGRAPHAPAAAHPVRPVIHLIRPGNPMIGHGFPRISQAQSTNWSGNAAPGRFASVTAS